MKILGPFENYPQKRLSDYSETRYPTSFLKTGTLFVSGGIILRFKLVVLFAIVTAMAALSAHAQSTATLAGVVTDPSGAVVANARVKVTSLETGAQRVIPTDGAGLYAVPSLQPGDYSMQVTTPGFAPFTVQKITLNVDQRATMNVRLSLATTGSTVEVQSAGTQIESQTMTVGQVIDAPTVQNLPLNGRHFLDLTVLTPGGVVAPTNGNLTSASRGLGANSFLTAGNREDSVNFQINGVNLNDMVQNQITFQPSINTTSEFKINNSTFSAEYGRSSGSIVNVSTRSGTNHFHGEVFDYFRNDALDARNYFNRAVSPVTGASLGLPGKKAPLKRNNFGASLGGPIFRDRTFFFGSYEALRQHQGILQNSTVFSNAPYTTVNSAGQTLYWPNQRAAIAALNKPAANALLALVPLPNSGNNYVAFTPGPVQIDQGTGDIMQLLGTADQLHGFYAFQRDVRTEPTLQGDTIPGFGDHRSAHRQILTINETHVFNPRVVNEARLGFNRISILFSPNVTLNPATLGIGDGINTNRGIPQITISDLSELQLQCAAGAARIHGGLHRLLRLGRPTSAGAHQSESAHQRRRAALHHSVGSQSICSGSLDRLQHGGGEQHRQLQLQRAVGVGGEEHGSWARVHHELLV